MRVRDVTRFRPPAASPQGAEESEAPPAEGADGAPTEDEEAPASRPGFWHPGQTARIKSDVAGDAKRYTSRLIPVSDPAGAMAGILAYALIINGIRYGKPGITGWWRAKFLNQPMQGQAPSALAPTTGGGTISV